MNCPAPRPRPIAPAVTGRLQSPDTNWQEWSPLSARARLPSAELHLLDTGHFALEEEVDRSLRNSFRNHRVKKLKSLLSITPQDPSTRSTGMMRTRLSMFSTGKLRCKFVEARFAGLVPGRYFTNHLKTFIP